MKLQLLSLLMLFILIGCQASGGGSGGDIIQGHVPVDNKFTLSTTNKTYSTGDSLDLVLTFPTAIVVAGGTPEITVTIGSTPINVPMTNLTSTTLTFSYTITAGDVDNDGIAVAPTLNKNGATIKYNTSYDTSTTIAVPNLSTVLVNPVGGTPPVAANITPAAFNEDTQSGLITLSYTDIDSDQATACSISSPTNVTVTQACACAAGVCTVKVTGTSNYNGAAGFGYTVTANGQVSNTAAATFTINPVADLPVAANITPASFNEDAQSGLITLSYTDGDGDLATACTISSPTNVTVTQACACASGVCTLKVTGTANYSGAASFNYTVTTNGQLSNSASASLTILPVADAPVAANITPAAFNEDTQSGLITLSYTDAENDQATACTISSPTNVTVTQACACAAGVCTVKVTGTSNYNGAASFNYTVTANSQTSNSATATLSITPVDDAPVAANITPAAFNSNTQSIITLSYTDVENNNATSCAISAPTNVTETQACACAAGVCTVGVTGTLNYFGAASFNYTVSNALTSNSATATLTINNSNVPPVANNITPAAFNEDVQSIITLSYTDANSDQATVCTISSPTNVTVTQACACAAGVCTVGVTGTLNYNGAASFAYTVTANGDVSNSANATLSITAVADAPVTANITPAAFNEDTQSVITLSYTDAESDQATACAISSPTNVTVTQACACAAGVCTVGVTGTLNYNGSASFAYTVDANSQTSNSSTATLTINPVDDAPVTANITPASFPENAQSVITLSYTDVDSDLASTCSISNLSNVTVTQACACAAGTCTVGVTGTLNYYGAASFDYTVTANSTVSNSSSASLTITQVNNPPVANNITPAAFNEDTQSVITLSYTDPDSDQATSCSIASPTNVTVTQACACAAGVCTVGVTGTSNYNGAASFNYTVTANTQTSNSATATLSITAVADAPVAANITPAAFNEDTQSGLITLSYTDAESDLATTCAISSPTNVTVTQACACAAGVCTVKVTGTANYNGAASFGYTVTANSQTSNTATATLSITAVDDAPVANNITPAAFNEDTQSVITLSYTDVESNLASTCSVSSPTNVTVTQACACVAGVCTVGVTGTSNYSGAASFAYTVTANSLVSNSATATLSITAVNDAPVAANITPAAFNEDTQSGLITLSYTDVESDQATSCSISALSNVTVTQACACAAGVCTVKVTGTSNYNGAASFGYTVTANSQTSNTATATLSITAVPDAPIAVNITPAAFNEDTASTITLTYTDAEGDFATSCSVSGLTNVTVTTPCSCTVGTCTVGVQGTSNYSGVASFNYTVTANSQTSNSATASLTISAVDDAPVASNISPAAFNEDTQSGVITLSYTDADSDQATSCSISSPTNVTVTQACACAAGVCTVKVTGTANYNGAASFGYTVTANSVASNTATATLSITAVNDAPTISAISGQSGNMNVAGSGISFTVNDVDNTLTCGSSMTMTSTNTTLIPTANVVWSGTAPNCTGTITPANDQFGTSTIGFKVSDGTLNATASFTLSITGSLLQFVNVGGTVISTYNFGTPGGNTTGTVYIKNNGNATSGTITVTDNVGSNKLSQTNTCTTLAVGSTCTMTITWDNTGGSGFRSEIYTATAAGSTGSSPTMTASGTK